MFLVNNKDKVAKLADTKHFFVVGKNEVKNLATGSKLYYTKFSNGRFVFVETILPPKEEVAETLGDNSDKASKMFEGGGSVIQVPEISPPSED